jgi:type II secretion system protein N
MTGKSLFLRGIALLLASAILFSGFVYLFFPSERIDRSLEQILQPQGLKVSPMVHKTLLPGLGWDNMQLSSTQGELLNFDRLRIRPLLFRLLTGRAVVAGTASIGKGRLDIGYAFNGKEALDLSIDDINLSRIPFFKTVAGARLDGMLWSQGKLLRGAGGLSGDLKLEVKQLSFSGIKLGAFPLPDAGGLKTQGMVRVVDNRARLESFTLEGEGIYMRLSGDLPTGASAVMVPLNMTLEIMPKTEFLEKQKLVFMLLAKFMASPGVYKVPIRGTLLKPEIL